PRRWRAAKKEIQFLRRPAGFRSLFWATAGIRASRCLTWPATHEKMSGGGTCAAEAPNSREEIMLRIALVVEDEADVGVLLAEPLRRWGFEPTLLGEGKPAIPWVREHQPDVILLDLLLPDMSGFTICENLKLDRETNLIPIVMVTALGTHAD